MARHVLESILAARVVHSIEPDQPPGPGDGRRQHVDAARLIRRRTCLGLAALLAPLAGAPPASATKRLLAPPFTVSPSQGPSVTWFDADSALGAHGHEALRLLADAASHGLDPADYAVTPLDDTPASRAAFDAALTAAVLRWLNDLHVGRAGPAAGSTRASSHRTGRFDAADVLRAALAMQDLSLAERAAVPPVPQYERLRDALATYRALSKHPAWQRALPALPRRVEPGSTWAGAPLLAERLHALGDLAVLPAARSLRADDAIVDAVRAFQQRHGLEPDGVVGRATLAALNVTPAQRARQLELALERLRAAPLLDAPRMIVVNIPEFVLRAYEVDNTERIALRAQMKVIVGRALDTRTPLIEEDLRRIEFQPYWNVPASIARKELLPLLARDPAVWAREGFEFVIDGRVEPRSSNESLEAVREGRARIRQRPGPRNALGDIKFVFPNRESIYLHHTPSTGLFERARRDFSHGCIRVEDPVALAAFALQDVPGWDAARIRDAMGEGSPSNVALPRPMPVLVAYGTALVKDGRVHFFDDIYGHDRVLDAALKARSAAIAASR